MGSIEKYQRLLKDFKDTFKIKMNVEKKEIDLDLTEILENYEIDDPFTIEKAMSEQPSLFFRFSSLLSAVKSQLRKAEFEKDIWYSEVRNRVARVLKNKAKEDALKAPTREDIENTILQKYKTEVQRREKIIRILENKIAILQAAVIAISQRKDMLVSVGSLTSRLLDQGILILDSKKKKKIWGKEKED